MAAASGNTDREIRIMRKKDEVVPDNEDQMSQSMNEAIRKLLTFSSKEIERDLKLALQDWKAKRQLESGQDLQLYENGPDESYIEVLRKSGNINPIRIMK